MPHQDIRARSRGRRARQRREEVIAYNEEDLMLTFSLWLYMVEGRTMVLGNAKISTSTEAAS
jgi:hypothetical protein